VTDFGVAELMSSWVREARQIYGTPGYLPPETLRGRGYDERGDVFAAGVVLWQCLAGQAPFAAESPEATAQRTLRLVLPALSSVAEGVPRELDDLMEALLRRDREQRLGSAAEAAERLEHMAWSHGWRWRPDVRPTAGAEPASTGHSRLFRALDTPTPQG
jgi:serine/threonine-protein kinase